MKNIIISFDGTWNIPDIKSNMEDSTSTNVFKLHQAIETAAATTIAQVKWYDTGVGTQWYDRFSGGIFGVGLSANIIQGYTALMDNYESGDRLFILGFSRGAYSARSLVGLIRNSGLLKKENKNRVNEAYQLYRNRDKGADTEYAQLFRNTYSTEVDIHFLGVWDTVGALGIPLESFGWFNREFYHFHDTELSGIVRHAYHAIAIDEHRENYDCTLWDPKQKPNQTVEQVWFPGAHANIGGGYADNNLSDITLLWMASKASACGLVLDMSLLPSLPQHFSRPVDSYKAFLDGAYSKLKAPYYRKIGYTEYGEEAINASVQEMLRQQSDYHPKNSLGDYLNGGYTPTGRIY
ncbi:DUF2235 domain-containing protein [Musicola keenii]|uniref:DUF2235 domain-containing protein n=1 Tax=Musicola keenii TaxID=2884250 RepID=UPI001784787E|nr:DUF2235 domain-containing protein [Musicola keenii]